MGSLVAKKAERLRQLMEWLWKTMRESGQTRRAGEQRRGLSLEASWKISELLDVLSSVNVRRCTGRVIIE